MPRNHAFDGKEHFKYIDVIRKPNGELRNWEEYNFLSKLENELDGSSARYTWMETFNKVKQKHQFLEKEDEKTKR